MDIQYETLYLIHRKGYLLHAHFIRCLTGITRLSVFLPCNLLGLVSLVIMSVYISLFDTRKIPHHYNIEYGIGCAEKSQPFYNVNSQYDSDQWL